MTATRPTGNLLGHRPSWVKYLAAATNARELGDRIDDLRRNLSSTFTDADVMAMIVEATDVRLAGEPPQPDARRAALEDLEHVVALALQAMGDNTTHYDPDQPDWRGPAVEQFRQDMIALGVTPAELDAAGITLGQVPSDPGPDLQPVTGAPVIDLPQDLAWLVDQVAPLRSDDADPDAAAALDTLIEWHLPRLVYAAGVTSPWARYRQSDLPTRIRAALDNSNLFAADAQQIQSAWDLRAELLAILATTTDPAQPDGPQR